MLDIRRSIEVSELLIQQRHAYKMGSSASRSDFMLQDLATEQLQTTQRRLLEILPELETALDPKLWAFQEEALVLEVVRTFGS